MTYEPQPFVATQSGPAGDAPSSAKPIALYGVEGGTPGGIPGVDDFIVNSQFDYLKENNGYSLGETLGALIGNVYELERVAEHLNVTKADTDHSHTVAQITGLQATIDDLTSRIEALETP